MNNAIVMVQDLQGNLVVEIRSPVESTFRYRNWSHGFRLECWSEGQWEPETMDSSIPLLHLAESEPDNRPVQAFVAMIPEDVRQAVAPYVYCQTRMLCWLSKSLPAQQLFASAPHLFWLLMARSDKQDWPQEHVEAALLQPRADILALVVGETVPGGLKWLQRIQLRSGDQVEYRALIHALANVDRLKPLQGIIAVPIHLVHAASRYPDLAHGRAFKSLSIREYERLTDITAILGKYDRYWGDALNVARLLGIQDAVVALRRCRDFTAVKQLHDRWTDRLNQQRCIAVYGHSKLPDPPLAGNDQVHPIRTLEDLREEGRLMHHCVASYIDAIMSGQCYIYRILQPQRATIEVRLRGDQASVRQVALAYNGKPNEDTLAAVQQWFDDAVDDCKARMSGSE